MTTRNKRRSCPARGQGGPDKYHRTVCVGPDGQPLCKRHGGIDRTGASLGSPNARGRRKRKNPTDDCPPALELSHEVQEEIAGIEIDISEAETQIVDLIRDNQRPDDRNDAPHSQNVDVVARLKELRTYINAKKDRMNFLKRGGKPEPPAPVAKKRRIRRRAPMPLPAPAKAAVPPVHKAAPKSLFGAATPATPPASTPTANPLARLLAAGIPPPPLTLLSPNNKTTPTQQHR